MSIYANSNVIEAISVIGGAGAAARQRGGCAPLDVQYLIVGGGGGASSIVGADLGNSFKGGGGGQVITGSALLGLSQTFTITVGRGETFNQTTSSTSSSLFGPLYGGGNLDYAAAGAVGTTSGTGKTAGTTSGAGSNWWGGGGGGSTSNGGNGVNPNAGNGGAGVTWIDGSGYGGGGGGGQVQSPTTTGGGGFDSDGGGSGEPNGDSTPTPYHGGGSGGSGGAVTPGGQTPGTNGASGSVIIAYPTPSSTATGISYGQGGVVTYTTINTIPYTIHTFTSSATFQTFVR